MSIKILFVSLVIMACKLSLVNAQELQFANDHEIRQIHFAERVIIIELARALSPLNRKEREKCSNACPETGAKELAIGLIGASRNDSAVDALINLLGVRLDGAASEERSCQILLRGNALTGSLGQLQPKQVVERCHSAFLKLKKRQLSHVRDVKVEQVCHSENDVHRSQSELLKAIKSKVMCD